MSAVSGVHGLLKREPAFYVYSVFFQNAILKPLPAKSFYEENNHRHHRDCGRHPFLLAIFRTAGISDRWHPIADGRGGTGGRTVLNSSNNRRHQAGGCFRIVNYKTIPSPFLRGRVVEGVGNLSHFNHPSFPSFERRGG